MWLCCGGSGGRELCGEECWVLAAHRDRHGGGGLGRRIAAAERGDERERQEQQRYRRAPGVGYTIGLV